MNRPRSFSAPPALASAPAKGQPRTLAHGSTRPTVLYFYCSQSDYEAILLHSALWISAGATAVHGIAKGAFPPGPYATTVGPTALAENLPSFQRQFYGPTYRPNLTHYVAFRFQEGWAPQGHTIMGRGDPAEFAWHWVGPPSNDWIVRTPLATPAGGSSINVSGAIISAVRIGIVEHGPIPFAAGGHTSAAAAASSSSSGFGSSSSSSGH